MRLLVLGGTRFLGRHVVDAALARRCEVTIFTRGRTPVPWDDRVVRRAGNRDPGIAPGLDAIAQGAWDAVIDTSGYLPRCVGASARLLADRVAHGVFVSSLSVYADESHDGQNEDAPLATLADTASEDVAANYGGLKAACEREFSAGFGGRATIVRPGLIVGPHDSTDRFPYWVARFVLSRGTRLARAARRRPRAAGAPAAVHRRARLGRMDAGPGRLADGRNLQRSDPARCGHDGNARGRARDARTRQGSRDRARLDRRREARRARCRALDRAAAVDSRIGPLARGLHVVLLRAGVAHGLRFRPLERTLADTADWLARRDCAIPWRDVLSGAKEIALLEDCGVQ